VSRLRRLFSVRPNEARFVLPLVALMILISAGISVGGNGIESLLFVNFGVRYLPYLYPVLAILTVLFSGVLILLLRSVSPKRLYVWLPLVMALLLGIERVMAESGVNALYAAMWLLMNVMSTIQLVFAFGLAGLVCDARQAKRLFPLFGAGLVAGTAVGGFGTQPLASALHAQNLLLVWAVALLGASVLARRIASMAPPVESPSSGAAPLVDELRAGYRAVRGSQLLLWLAVAWALLWILYYVLVFLFAQAATRQFPRADALAGFLGIFQGSSMTLALVASLFIANRLYSRFGTTAVLLAFGILYATGFALLALEPSFAATAAFRLLQMATYFGIASSAYQAVFAVVPFAQRSQARLFVEGVASQVGIAVAGFVLIAAQLFAGNWNMALIGVPIGLLVSYALWRARSAYRPALIAALRAGQPILLHHEDEPLGGVLHDVQAVQAVVAGLESEDPVVRRVTAEIARDSRVPAAAEPLRKRLTDSDPLMRELAVEALARIDGHRNLDVLRPMLSDPDESVRAAAAAGLASVGDPAAKSQLRQLVVAEDEGSRYAAVRAIGHTGMDTDGILVQALRDASASVRRAAALALAQSPSEEAVRPLLASLADPDSSVRRTAARALHISPYVDLRSLLPLLDDPEREDAVIDAIPDHAPREALDTIGKYLVDRAHLASRYRVMTFGLLPDPHPTRDLLRDSLTHKARSIGTRAVRAMGKADPGFAAANVLFGLASADAEQRAAALEAVESVGRSDVGPTLVSLWESSGGADPKVGEQDVLRELMADSDAWLRACSIELVSIARRDELVGDLRRLAASDTDELVRNLAESALVGGDQVETLSTLSVMDRIIFLRRVSVFAEIPPGDLKQIAAIAREELLRAGEVLAHQGDPGKELSIVVSGEIRVVTADDDVANEIRRVTSGDYVGEMSILSHKPMTASLIAVGETRILCIDKGEFELILRESPETSLSVISVLCDRVASLTPGVSPINCLPR
jgi:HEAT repeat protein